MSYKFNPLVSLGLDQIASYDALNLLGTVANQAALPGSATTGDVYQAEDTGIFYVWDGAAWDSIGTLAGPAGPAGATGPAGADGADGQTILNGTVDPTDNVTGTDGDFYINTTSNEIFGPRTAGVWGSGTSLVGPGGGATTLGGLTDVDLTTSPPTNGEALVYDSVNSEWVPGSAGATAAGSANQVQYNDGAGGLAASADLTWDNTAKELGVGGDLNLDDGGTFSTTVQSVTPTANRTISFPDATGTVALVSGSNGTIQYNDTGTLKGSSDFTVDPDWNDASTVFTGLKLNVTDTASAAGSNLLDLQSGGTSKLFVTNTGAIRLAGQGGASPRLIYDQYGHGLGSVSGGASLMSGGGDRIWAVGGGAGTTSLYFTSNSASSLSNAAALVYDTDNFTIGQRNGTAAQTYRLYNTWGNNGVDFERTSLTRDSSGLVIDAQKGGTGVDPTNLLDVKLGGTSQLRVNQTGQIYRSNVPATSGIRLKINNGVTDYGISDNNGHVNITYNNDLALSVTSDKLGLGQGRYIGFGLLRSTDASDLGLARDSAGVLKITDGSTGTGYLKLIPTTVGALTAAATVGAGTKAFVTDSTSTLSAHHGQAVVGGGNNFVPVFSDGTNWIVG